MGSLSKVNAHLSQIFDYLDNQDLANLGYASKSLSSGVDVVIWRREEYSMKESLGHYVIINPLRRALMYAFRAVDEPAPTVNKLADKVVARELLMQRTSESSSLVDHYATQPDEVFRLLKVFCGPIQAGRPLMFSSSEAPIALRFRGDSIDRPSTFVRFLAQQDGASPKRVITAMNGRPDKFTVWSLEHGFPVYQVSHSGATDFAIEGNWLVTYGQSGMVKVWYLAEEPAGNPFHQERLLNPYWTLAPTEMAGIKHACITTVALNIVTKSHVRLAVGTDKGDIVVCSITNRALSMLVPANRLCASNLKRASMGERGIAILRFAYERLAIATASGLIRVIDLRSGRIDKRFAGHEGGLVAMEVPDKIHVWSFGSSGNGRWWRGKGGMSVWRSPLCRGKVSSIKSNDVVVLASYSKQGMQAWDMRSRKPIRTFVHCDYGGISQVDFNSRLIVTLSTRGQVALWGWGCQQPLKFFAGSFTSCHLDDFGLILGNAENEFIVYRF